MNKPTPETDAETIYCDAMPNMPWVDADICRKLERERDEAREALEYIAHSGLSARHIEDYAKDFLSKK